LQSKANYDKVFAEADKLIAILDDEARSNDLETLYYDLFFKDIKIDKNKRQ